MKKITFTTIILFVSFIAYIPLSLAQVTDMGGIDWTINTDTTLGGKYVNIGTFRLNAGKTITVSSSIHFFEVEASVITIQGTIDATGKGDAGGIGGIGGAFANGSGVSGKGGLAGSNGAGLGGGKAGFSGGDGGFITQICGGLFCSGNRDGFNGGGGGAGGGSGGSYGGVGATGGWGAYGTGFTGASGGVYGNGGLVSTLQGNITDHNISYGAGGGGAGGGGGGWSSGTAGGAGGNGGGMVSLFATDTITLTITARIYCNGSSGNTGGNGGGESDDNSYDCTTSGYDACGLCSQSVYDGAGGAGAGAGGGAGGGVKIMSPGVLKLKSGALIQANGGNGGIKGYPNSTVGTCFDNAASGGGGSGGRIKIITTCNPANEYDVSQQVYGGTGYQTGASGTNNIIPIYPDTAGPITGPTTVCAASQSNYIIDPVDNAETYLWSLPSGAHIISGSNTNSITVQWDTLSTSGTISVTPQNACGDGLFSILSITVQPLPVFTVVPGGQTSVCYYTPATLTATFDTSYTYQWQQDINCNGSWVNIPGADSSVFETSPLTEGTCFRLIVTNNCGSINSSSLFIAVNNTPPTPVIGYLDINTLTSDALTGNQWYNTQGAITGATGQNFAIPSNDNYYVIVTDSNGCVSAPSNTISFIVGINSDDLSISNVYPNPTKGIINYSVPAISREGVIIQITDANGKEIFSEIIFTTKGQISLMDYEAGIYTIALISSESTFKKQIVFIR